MNSNNNEGGFMITQEQEQAIHNRLNYGDAAWKKTQHIHKGNPVLLVKLLISPKEVVDAYLKEAERLAKDI